MARNLQITLNHDALSIGMEIPLSPFETWWEDLKARNSAARDAEGDEVAVIRHWVQCKECQADASHLGAVHLEGRLVRICTRCQSLFEVADGSS